MNTNNPLNFYTNLDMAQYQLLSPSGSPHEAAKNTIINRPVRNESLTAASLLPQQNMSGPSFPYGSYQQHTGLVAGSIANTHAINQSLSYNGYLSNADSGLDFNFNSPMAQTSPFDSPLTDTMDATNASPVRQTVDPSRLQSESNQSSNTNMRVYNGFHTNQAAAAAAEAARSKIKVEAQQMQQQQIIQQQQQQRQAAQSAKPQKPRVQMPADPLLDQKITQVLNQFRQQDSSNMDLHSPGSPDDGNRSQSKDLDDMDEDERLLNSEEGKKLTPKERRQLRNKVSARHFRKRRKEMIVDLEAVNQNLTRENDQLKLEKEKLISDNQNLRKFVEHMIKTPYFANYLEASVLNLGSQQTPIAASPQVAQSRGRQQSQQFSGLPMIAEQNQTLQLADVLTDDALFPDESMNDFSMPMLSTQNSNEFDMFSSNENTQIFAVLDTPMPSIDISTLSGKTSNFVGQQEEFDSHDEKVEIPPIEKCPTHVSVARPVVVEKVETTSAVDEDFDNDPAFALYHQTSEPAESVSADKPVAELDIDGLSHVDLFGGIELEKVFERYELVDASEEEVGAALAMERVQRISSAVESVMARLELLTIDL
ncbi:hypothetical protein GE09DRAFT_305083 [Coniochaeta sp. 2T2.1]|nr:hypothetical protein GE09DRAFT_305083 [Coniochaeta sp. 2T2.1]